MKAGAGKRKGSGFEREVGKALSLWLTGGKDATQLIRSALSGGWEAGLSGQEPWRHVGDLAPNGPVGDRFRRRIAVECKHHRSIDLWGLWTGKKGSLLAWWEKIDAEVSACERPFFDPLLVFRANFMPTMVMTTRSVYDQLSDIDERLDFSAVVVEWLDVVIFPFYQLLSVNPDKLDALYRESGNQVRD